MRMLMRFLLAVFLLTGFGGLANAQLNEINKDRPGNDISSQNIGPNPSLCAQNCAAVGACRAWTYVKPGVQGPSARCYLKNVVPAQTNDNCCVSGVKLSGSDTGRRGLGRRSARERLCIQQPRHAEPDTLRQPMRG